MVSDSNYDWGQGLLELADNMRPFARADQPVWVVYWEPIQGLTIFL